MPLMTEEAKAALYAEIPKSLKERLAHLAKVRSRKITAELVLALERYVDEEEAKEGISDADEDDSR